MSEDSIELSNEDLEDIAAFDFAMADLAPNIPWSEVEEQLAIEP